MPATDEELILEAISGDEEALCTLLERFGPVVRRGMAGKIAAHWRAAVDPDDIMQVTYLEAFLQIQRFTPTGPGAFPAWLSRIAKNNLRDAIKGLERAKRPNPKKQVRAPGGATHEDSCVALVEVLGVTTSTPSRAAARIEAGRMIDAALEQLPNDYAVVIREYDLGGKEVDEVAQALGRSRGAVYMLRARAHDRLRELLGTDSQFFSTPA